MAAADAPECHPAALDWPVLVHGAQGVSRTGRRIPAGGGLQGRNHVAVYPDKSEQQFFQEPGHGMVGRGFISRTNVRARNF